MKEGALILLVVGACTTVFLVALGAGFVCGWTRAQRSKIAQILRSIGGKRKKRPSLRRSHAIEINGVSGEEDTAAAASALFHRRRKDEADPDRTRVPMDAFVVDVDDEEDGGEEDEEEDDDDGEKRRKRRQRKKEKKRQKRQRAKEQQQRAIIAVSDDSTTSESDGPGAFQAAQRNVMRQARGEMLFSSGHTTGVPVRTRPSTSSISLASSRRRTQRG